MEYNFSEVEKKWQAYWAKEKTFRAENNSSKPKYYVLDMFPYPSGAGLHVGHPLGYIASDIYARYKRLKGFNVLHPMGYDSFGLPAEQYAIQTGQHPAITTETNIARYREQLDKIGFSFDWEREVRTSNPDYYKWTQWIFIKLFHSWYNTATNKAEPIENLIEKFKNNEIKVLPNGEDLGGAWNDLTDKQKSDVLMEYRLAYLSETYVNWCPQLGTVLANEEVKDGLSERGGYPVERKLMPQWSLRITAYADRLLNDLEGIDWSESIKEAQRNWIGKSDGTSLEFRIQNSELTVEVFTTRPDTVFGVTFVTLAPEHELIEKITTSEYKQKIDEYIHYAKNRSERDRISEVKKITGQFTGAYVIHPFTNEKIPVWIGDYVLAGYGTGAVMGVPAHDSRDHAFATHFAKEGLTVKQVITAPDGWSIDKEAWEEKQGTLINSDFLNGLEVKAAIKKCIAEIENKNIGKGKTNYRLRDAIFGRQRYWGEPIPIYYKNGIPYTMDENDLPLLLPEVDKYLPTETGEPPLARAANWTYTPHLNPPQKGGLTQEEENKTPSYETADRQFYGNVREASRENRKNPTEAENVLWQHLKNEQTGYKIRRQHIIDVYIADFVSLNKKVVIEVDGGYHNDQKDYDAARTEMLNVKGFSVIRFTNDEVLKNPKEVQQKIKKALDEKVLPLGEDLGGAYPLETTTMPGWAGSSWYYLRYMDAHNDSELVSKEAVNYWKEVDLYIGGSEHATGHLLYVRFWTKFLNDLGVTPTKEPAKKLINQGMIQGVSEKIYKYAGKSNQLPMGRILNDELKARGGYALSASNQFNFFYSAENVERAKIFCEKNNNTLEIKRKIERITASLDNVDISMVTNSYLDITEFIKWRPEYHDAVFICTGGYWQHGQFNKYLPGDVHGEIENGSDKFKLVSEVEKMSKSKWNVVTPDDIIEKSGADCLRMYEMFLGPLEQSKPWNTNGISGVNGFIRKLWKLYHSNKKVLPNGEDLGVAFYVSDDAPSKAELKTLHKTIKKVQEDIEKFSFNTSVSSFMICVNELTELKCNKRAILEPLAIILSPYAPHIAEELWSLLGHKETITYATFPEWKEEHLVEDEFEYPISVNGKTRFKINLPLNITKEEIERQVLAAEDMQKWTNGVAPKKVIVVPGRIVNIVV